jgi:carboxyl-terminal processing protease
LTSGGTVPTTEIPPDTTSTAPDSSSETTQAVTGTTVPVTQVECGQESDGLLCEGYSLINRYYVDPVADAALALAAASGVEALDGARSTQTLTCAVPNDDFDQVCRAMAIEGAETVLADEAALAGMIAALDPNSSYLDPEALALLEEEQSGEVQGIGALVASEDLTAEDPETTPCSVVSKTCRLVVVSTFTNSPAERAGLQPGDVFVAVNGEPIDGWNVDLVTATVRGRAGTPVSLTVDRDGQRVDINIIRAALTIPVVESDVVEDVGYLRLNLFTETADHQVHDALTVLLDNGIERLVLDLRDNPGGALDATVNIASEFLDDGIVVRTQSPDNEMSYEVESGGIATSTDLEVVILVNRGSASASEVLSAALQEAHRAVVIGENTFGKNTVQQRFGLSNGGALKLTVARWVTALGADFGEGGVTPDILAEIESGISVSDLVAEVSSLAGWQ